MKYTPGTDEHCAVFTIRHLLPHRSTFSPAKFLDGKIFDDHPKHFAVEIEIVALQLEIFYTLINLFLFTHIVPETLWLTTPSAD